MKKGYIVNLKLLVLPLLAALSLAACSGGGGSSSSSVPAVVYPMSGAYGGTLSNSSGSTGQMGLVIESNGASAYGDLVIAFTGEQETIVNFSSSGATIAGNNLTINAILTAASAPTLACAISLHATMVGPDEIKGSYTGGDGKADCGGQPPTTVSFDLTRTQLQSLQKQLKSIHAAGSN